MQKVLLCLIGLGLFKGQVNGQRTSELSCYECAAKSSNDTCTDEYRKTVKVTGFDSRCRIMEMNGKVVSQGVVPKTLCTQTALAKVSDLFSEEPFKRDTNTFIDAVSECREKSFLVDFIKKEVHLPVVVNSVSEQIRLVDISP